MARRHVDIDNERFPHICLITRERKASGSTPFDRVPLEEEVIYDGKCRSYQRNSYASSKTGDVMTDNLCISVPLTIKDCNDLYPMTNDKVVVFKGSIKEYGKVVSIEPGTIGSTIYWKYEHN